MFAYLRSFVRRLGQILCDLSWLSRAKNTVFLSLVAMGPTRGKDPAYAHGKLDSKTNAEIVHPDCLQTVSGGCLRTRRMFVLFWSCVGVLHWGFPSSFGYSTMCTLFSSDRHYCESAGRGVLAVRGQFDGGDQSAAIHLG